jgi:hypothetical protein
LLSSLIEFRGSASAAASDGDHLTPGCRVGVGGRNTVASQ